MTPVEQLLAQLQANYNTLHAAAMYKLQTNSALLAAKAVYSQALANLGFALAGGNQEAINMAAQAVLVANTAMTTAEMNDRTADLAFAAANAQFVQTQAALAQAIANLP